MLAWRGLRPAEGANNEGMVAREGLEPSTPAL